MQPLRDPRPTPDLKICGITDPEQAQAIAQMGVQAIGVIGVPATPRFVEPAPVSYTHLTLPTIYSV